MKFSDKLVSEAKEEFKKKGKEMTDDEAQEALRGLVGLFDILWEMSVKDTKRKNRLKLEPKGFPVEAQHTCIVCYRVIDPETGWYDHNNQKCLSCQKVVDGGIFPAFICHHRKSFYLTWELKELFNIHSASARKLVREGKLIARIAHNDQYNTNEYVFLKKENPGLISRYSPERKSYDRNKKKVGARQSREFTKKMRAERKAEKQKSQKRDK